MPLIKLTSFNGSYKFVCGMGRKSNNKAPKTNFTKLEVSDSCSIYLLPCTRALVSKTGSLIVHQLDVLLLV